MKCQLPRPIPLCNKCKNFNTEKCEWFPVIIKRGGDVFKHLILAAKNAPSTIEGQFAALFHDIGKPKTRREMEDDVKFPGHATVGAAIAHRILERLDFDDDLIDTIVTSIGEHMRVHDLTNADDDELKDFLDDMGKEEALDAINTSKADEKGAWPRSNKVPSVEKRVRKLAE